MSKVKRVVTHPKLYLAVAGVLTHVAAGTEVSLTAEQAKGLGSKVADPKASAAVELSAAPTGPSEAEKAAGELAKRLAAAEAAAKAAEARADKAEKALIATASKAK